MVVDTSSASLTLRQLQLTQLRMLRVFAAVCERHGLRFWLTAGTLLGAIRHGGFIPWDDDVDVAMPRRDFERLGGLSREWEAEGCCWQSEKTDRNYPFPFGKLLFQGLPVVEAENGRGILICGTGIGMSIAANRHAGIRAALCTTELHARFTRLHNNANVLCLGARVTGVELALAIMNVFLDTAFEGGRHQRRLDQLNPQSAR